MTPKPEGLWLINPTDKLELWSATGEYSVVRREGRRGQHARVAHKTDGAA